jgi:hypothetical protein
MAVSQARIGTKGEALEVAGNDVLEPRGTRDKPAIDWQRAGA